MHKKLQTYFGAGLLIIVVGIEATSISLPTGPAGTIHNMNYLGTVDGKSYFAENSLKRNWRDAKKICDESGMQLATITSELQASILNDAYNNVTFAEEHWVAGIETQKLYRFDWAYTDENINQSYVSLDAVLPTVETCLSYVSYSTTSVYHGHTCITNIKTLCEIRH